MELPPFTRPLRLVPDAEAWTMPPWAWSPSAWARDIRRSMLDVRGVHRLLHAASLPEAELRHMGAAPSMLGYLPEDASMISEAVVIPVLGRIVLDQIFNSGAGFQGPRWDDSPVQRAMVAAYGRLTIEEFFS
jgi:hypothetical protein